MKILSDHGLSGCVKILLDLAFFGGLLIYITLPFCLKDYLNLISLDRNKSYYSSGNENYYFLLVLLYITGFFCLVLVFEMIKIFKTINNRNPFQMNNSRSLRKISACSFAIAAAYIVKIFIYNSFLTIIIAMVFILAGLFTIILAELFKQAVIYKEENDLTI